MQRFRLHGPKQIVLDDVPEPAPATGELLISVRSVGICGSDKHYFAHGRCGPFVPKTAFALGHEFSGIVAALGDGVAGFQVGDAVAVDPLLACGCCPMCRSGHANLCAEKRYMGSAAAWPHVDGAMGDKVCVPAGNVYRLPESISLSTAAMIEPASVAFHAVRRAGDVHGATVLIIGGGAIGQLILRIAKALGAKQAVLVDMQAYNRSVGLRSGADLAIDPLDQDAIAQMQSLSPGGFDIAWEAAGAPQALTLALERVRKGGVIVQVGTLPDLVQIPANLIMAREIDLRGSVQYHKAFPDVMALLTSGRLHIDDLVTQRFPFARVPEALAFALDSRESIKILVDMSRETAEYSHE